MFDRNNTAAPLPEGKWTLVGYSQRHVLNKGYQTRATLAQTDGNNLAKFTNLLLQSKQNNWGWESNSKTVSAIRLRMKNGYYIPKPSPMLTTTRVGMIAEKSQHGGWRNGISVRIGGHGINRLIITESTLSTQEELLLSRLL